MRIRDITVADVRAGKNWCLREADVHACIELPLEEWGPIAEATTIAPEDHVVYSGIEVHPSGRVIAVVCLREVQYLDWGGEYCEFVDGAWRQIGLVPNPHADPGDFWIADPLPNDPSFDTDSHDERQYQRDNFLLHAHKLRE